MKAKISLVQLVLIHLANRGCLTLEELERLINAKRSVLLVTLTRLHKRGVLYRKWRHFAGRKYREYCLKGREEILH